MSSWDRYPWAVTLSLPSPSYPLSLSLPHSQEVLLKHSRMQFTLQLSDLPREPKKLVLVQQNKVR